MGPLWWQGEGTRHGDVACRLDRQEVPPPPPRPTLVSKTMPSKNVDVEEENRAQRHGFGVRLWKRMKAIQDGTAMNVYGNKSAW